MDYPNSTSGYRKRPMWQWVLIYAVVGGLIYAVVYYFLFAKKGGGYTYDSSLQPAPQKTTQTSPVSQNSVQISNFSYSPATLTVRAGESVTWTNQDSAGHSATADDKSFDTGVLSQGQSGSIKFDKPGTYTYYCSVHPKMKATIVVQ